MHVYEVRPRKDKRGVYLVSDVLPFGRLWYGDGNAVANAIGYAKHRSRSHDVVIQVYDAAGNVIETPITLIKQVLRKSRALIALINVQLFEPDFPFPVDDSLLSQSTKSEKAAVSAKCLATNSVQDELICCMTFKSHWIPTHGKRVICSVC